MKNKKNYLAILLAIALMIAVAIPALASDMCEICDEEDCICEPVEDGIDLDALNALIEEKMIERDGLIAEFEEAAMPAFDAANAAYANAIAAFEDEEGEKKAFEDAQEAYEALKAVYADLSAKYVAKDANVSYANVKTAYDSADSALKAASAAKTDAETAMEAIDAAKDDAAEAMLQANGLLDSIAALDVAIADLIGQYNVAAAKAAHDENAAEWEAYREEMNAYTQAFTAYLKDAAEKTAVYLANLRQYRDDMKQYRVDSAQYDVDLDAYFKALDAFNEWEKEHRAYEAWINNSAKTPDKVTGYTVVFQGQGNESSFVTAINKQLPAGVSVAKTSDVNSSGITFTFGDSAKSGYFDIAIKIGDGNNNVYSYRVFVEPGQQPVRVGANPGSGWGTDFRMTVGAFVEKIDDPGDPPAVPDEPKAPEEPTPPTKPEIGKFDGTLPEKPGCPGWDSMSFEPYGAEPVGFNGAVWSAELSQLPGMPDERSTPSGKEDEVKVKVTPDETPEPVRSPAPVIEREPETEPELAVTIADPEVPQADFPPVEEPIVAAEIINPDVPLSELPQTGVLNIYGIFLLLGLMIAGTGFAVTLTSKKRSGN